MPAQDEYVEIKPPALWTTDGKLRQKCSVRSCKGIAGSRGLCRDHLGDRKANRLREQVRSKGIDILRRSR